ncbi:MAG: hypothetical protein QOJ32_1383, partial [Frankiaceae bacterium]|nr:hypothetical protein [Frankiaceae bacterium]
MDLTGVAGLLLGLVVLVAGVLVGWWLGRRAGAVQA